MGKMYLPDINFWLALMFDAHVHHFSAKAWMDALTEETGCFCRLTQQGFLRLANNPRVFPHDAVSMADAWRLYDTAVTDPRVSFASEPAALDAGWRSLTQRAGFAPNSWNDA
jgi:toxin-antitoxin system PIN domain toxin